MSERVLVTGGAGYVGSELCRQLSQAGHQLCVIDRLSYGRGRVAELQGLGDLCEIDLLDRRSLARSVESFSPEVVIHLAALHFVPACNARPLDAIELNAIATESLLTVLANAADLRRVLLASSAAVYGISDDFNREVQGPAPTDIYGMTKAINERQAARFTADRAVETVPFRLFNVFGEGETNPHVIPEIIDQLRGGGSQLMLGNVEPKRSYVHVEDVARGLIALLDCRLPEPHHIVNLGVREEASVREIVEMFAAHLGRELTIGSDAARCRPSDRMWLRCDPSRIEALTDWRPQYDLSTGLKRLCRSEGLQ